MGLTSTEAQLAWNKAVELAGKGRITARTVKADLKVLGFGQVKADTPKTVKLSQT